MNSLSLDSAQRIFIVSLCALSLSALGEMLAVQAYVMAKWLLCCAALGLVGSLAQSTVMLGLFFFVLSLLTVLNVYFFFLFGAIQSLSECNMIKDRYSLFRFRVALAPRHAYRPLTRAPSAPHATSRCQETHVAIVCMGLQMLLGGLSSVLACNLLLLWKERARKKA